MATALVTPMDVYSVSIPRFDSKRFKTIIKALGWTATKENISVQSYTMTEINARLDQAEKEFAAGTGIPMKEAQLRMKNFVDTIL